MSSNINAYKYIRTASGFFIWPESSGIFHKDMKDYLGLEPISAGFAYTNSNGFKCFGESISLGVRSAKEDSALLNQQMNIEME